MNRTAQTAHGPQNVDVNRVYLSTNYRDTHEIIVDTKHGNSCRFDTN